VRDATGDVDADVDADADVSADLDGVVFLQALGEVSRVGCSVSRHTGLEKVRARAKGGGEGGG
jgi:hypothetical protein